MVPQIKIKELRPINIAGGYLIDGFPSVGFSNAIATESMIHTTQFETVGYFDSDLLPPVSIIKDGIPNYPTNILVNLKLKTAIFSSYLFLPESLHREVAHIMLSWAQKHRCSFILSSIAIKSANSTTPQIIAAASTEAAKIKLKEAKIPVLTHGTVSGLPGVLLTEGRYTNKNVIVLIFNSEKENTPDFKSGSELCKAMSKLIPGVSCNLAQLEKEAKLVEQDFKETVERTKSLAESMYR